jgi:DNA-binding response OmpR family regulator
MKILIVEDDRSIAETLEVFCTMYHASCEITDSIEGAMASLEIEKPDYILLDIWLNGEFGTPIIGIARDWYPDEPPNIIVMSAMSGSEKIAEQNNADYYIAKPFDIDILEEIIFRKSQKRIDGFQYLR